MNAAESRAAQWIARLHAEDRSPADEAALRAWLEEDERHAAAFERVTMVWDMVPGSCTAQPVRRRPALTRRGMLMGIGAVTATGASALVGVSAAFAGTRYETGIGERRTIRLRDGSQLLLDAASRVTADAWPRYRKLWLEEGRVRLSIVPGTVPFEVEAGGERIIASPGRLDLRRDAGSALSVTSIAGRVSVITDSGTRHLTPGERLRASPGGMALDRPDTAQTEAWIDGHCVFNDDTIAQIVQEANRYASPPLAVADRQTAAMRVSGVYRLGDNAELARALASLLGLDVRADGETILLGRKKYLAEGVG
ncbi:DUF4880 domain-containing protein [Sphingomonadaceae bacterium jetA1]|uniref:FecR family protein n=1 Tax=Facivitalis istanbulensis TaxID=3075838 RepID=UPI00347A793C